MTALVSRRRILSIALAAGGAVTAGSLAARRSMAAEQPPGAAREAADKVSEKDSLAVALGYVSDAKRVDQKANPTFQAGSSCSGCSWFQGKAADADGPCTFFPGKRVDSHGWCKMWNKKQ